MNENKIFHNNHFEYRVVEQEADEDGGIVIVTSSCICIAQFVFCIYIPLIIEISTIVAHYS